MNKQRAAAGQIPLPFGKFEQTDFALFQTGDDIEAVTSLRGMASGAELRNIFLWGQAGTGKSHLLQAVCTLAYESGRTAAYVPLDQIADLRPDMLTGLATYDLVCVDDLDCLRGDAAWEHALFNLFNELREQRKPLLFAAADSPRGIAVQMPDLKSRLAWDLVYHLAPLDEALLVAALTQRARSRMFELPAEVVEFLVKRLSRDTHTLFNILDQLDEASIQSQRKLTIPFVKSTLGLD